MNQNHNENRGVHIRSFIYCTGIGHCPSTGHSYIRQHTINGAIQKKKDSHSDFQGLLFVFECIVVIISSHLFKEDSHTTKTDLYCYCFDKTVRFITMLKKQNMRSSK